MRGVGLQCECDEKEVMEKGEADDKGSWTQKKKQESMDNKIMRLPQSQ